MTDKNVTTERHVIRYIILFVPLALFLGLVIFFYLQLVSGRDIRQLPSVLINQKAPSIDLKPLKGIDVPGLNDQAIKGKLNLLNVWASWCVPCRQEHPYLMMLAQDERLNIVGLNYKDKPFNAAQFLTGMGNPYDAIGVDPNGETAIDWSVYGVPETFLISPEGLVLYRHIGPITDLELENNIMPLIEKILR